MTIRVDGTLGGGVPIWVVCAAGAVYVRTWYRRDTGWYARALRSLEARIRVPGLEIDVAVEDVADRDAQVRADVDAAYRTKYGTGVDQMVGQQAAATTLQLHPRTPPAPDHD